MHKIFIESPQASSLFFDDSCPLCLKTVAFIQKYIGPHNTNYLPLSSTPLDPSLKIRAYEEMLLISAKSHAYWGYYTYSKLLSMSSRKYRVFLRALSFIMLLPIVRWIGCQVYKRIASTRQRCTPESCSISS